jgi:hypothetical protein
MSLDGERVSPSSSQKESHLPAHGDVVTTCYLLEPARQVAGADLLNSVIVWYVLDGMHAALNAEAR